VIRLTTHTPIGGPAEVKIEGRLDAGSIQSLQDLLDSSPPNTTLNLSGLTSVDRDGGVFLIRQRESGVTLRGGSLYINRLLEEA
jgi:hypothetical protein